MFLQKPFLNYSQTTLIWIITHTQTKHKDLLGFVLNPNSITCNLTMNPTSKGGFHTLDPIRIYFRVRFLTTHNPQTCIIQIYTKFHTKIQRSILESIPFFSSSLLLFSSSSLPLPLLLYFPLLFFSTFLVSNFLETNCSYPPFELRPCLAFAFLNSFLIFEFRSFLSLLFSI